MRFAFLDSLRGLAALSVVLQHLFEHRPGFLGEQVMPFGPGVVGVAVLFFVSGYVMPLSTGTTPRADIFIVRRLFRIYPLLLVAFALALAAGASGFLGKWAFMTDASAWQWIANILLIQDFVGQRAFLGVTWTLTVELVWYGLFLAAILRYGNRAADVLDIFVPASLAALAILSLIVDVRIPLGRPMMIYAAVLGFQAWRLHTGAIERGRFVRSAAAFILIALAGTLVSFGYFQHSTLSLQHVLGPWAVGTAIFLVITLMPRVRDSGVLNRGALPMLGLVAYSTYLLHPLTVAIADDHFAGPWRVPVALALTALASVAGYHLVEKPGIALGRRVARALAARQAAVAAA
jgi:peptidoglycan/LPS O-acetylase OafA/YrhL